MTIDTGDGMLEEGDRVFVTGTKHHGFRGTVHDVLANGVMVLLDEWTTPIKFYRHQLLYITNETNT